MPHCECAQVSRLHWETGGSAFKGTRLGEAFLDSRVSSAQGRCSGFIAGVPLNLTLGAQLSRVLFHAAQVAAKTVRCSQSPARSEERDASNPKGKRHEKRRIFHSECPVTQH